MNQDTNIKGALEDDHFVRVYRPIETAACRGSNGEWTEVEHNQPDFVLRYEEQLDQDILQRYDALHFWFAEACDGEGDSRVPTTTSEMIGAKLAEATMRPGHIVLERGRVPDWKDIRDRATIVSGHGIENIDECINTFKEHHTGGFIRIDVDDIHTRTERSTYSTLYMLLDMEKQSKKIIEDRLCESFTTREALAFMSADPDDEIKYTMYGETVVERKWFLESKWMTDYFVEKFPKFNINFRTILITNAFRRFMNDDYSINRLYRVLAMLGRVNTKVVFIG